MVTDKNEDLVAEDIAEELLYRTGRIYLTGNLEHGIDYFEFPHSIETQDGNRVVETVDDFRTVFEAVRRYFKENGITDVVRTVVSAEFIERNLIGSTHVTRLMREDQLFRAPYPAYSLLRQSGGTWRIAHSVFAIVDSPEHNAALLTGTLGRSDDGSDGTCA